MRPVHTIKNGKRYRYYVSPPLVDSSVEAGASGWRIPAEEIEGTLATAISQHLDQPAVAADLLENSSTERSSAARLSGVRSLRDTLRATETRDCKVLLRQIVGRIDLTEKTLRAAVALGPTLGECNDEQNVDGFSFEIESPIKLVRRGAELKLILKGAAGESTVPDAILVRSILDSRRRLHAYTSGSGPMTVSAIAAAERINPADVSRSLQLAFLAPEVVSAILDGRQPAHLTATRLQRLDNLPLYWDEQRALIG